jgi:hypothetical protein
MVGLTPVSCLVRVPPALRVSSSVRGWTSEICADGSGVLPALPPPIIDPCRLLEAHLREELLLLSTTST